MPTSKTFRGSQKKAATTELKLEMDAYKSNLKERERLAKKLPKTFAHCGETTKANVKTVSLNTLSIQNLEFPTDMQQQKPIFKVLPEQQNITFVGDSSRSTPPLKKRGYDFTSSTNSHFDGWVFTAPKKHRRKCSSTTTSSPKAGKSGTPASTSLKSSTLLEKQPDVAVTSREMQDSQHKASLKRVNFNGPEWQKPCQASFVAGAPRPYIGTCPINIDDLAKMSRARQKFFLTQDPRKKYCLRNPKVLRRKAYSTQKEFDTLTKMVKHADNVCAGTASQSSESFICEVIDLENPLELDFQGMDYKNTYHKDEQDQQNQRIYNRICRFQDRKHVKRETEEMVQHELQHERMAVPQCFQVADRNVPVVRTPSVESIRYGKLFRSIDKPYNQERIKAERVRRRQNYKELFLRKKQRDETKEREREAAEKEAADQLATTLAQKNFDKVIQNINDAFQRSFIQENQTQKKAQRRRIFPHTMRETLQLKKTLKTQNRVRRDEARIKQQFYLEQLGQQKDYPETLLEISSDSATRHDSDEQNAVTPSELSSDDEDTMQVGKEGEVIKLRGFQFKLGKNIRGKRHQTELTQGQRKEKGCMTRDQWLHELAPKKEHIKLDVEVGIEKIKSPDDPSLVLFRPTFGFRPPKAETSAVRQYIQKRLGRHYDRMMRKNLKLVKPRLRYAVKKFNLISFLYGDSKKRMQQMKSADEEVPVMELPTTLDYMNAKHRLKQQRQNEIKLKRMELLGIPCREVKKSSLRTKCEHSDSETDSDWVPDMEPELSSNSSQATPQEPNEQPMPTLRQRGNMPAPKYRESTLRRHPRRPRDYFGERVPSAIFNEAVQQTGIPHMRKLPPDQNVYENVRQQKRRYTDMFEARHHHDHWNPTQLRLVDVCYQSQIVAPQVTQLPTKDMAAIMHNFQMANPPCNAYVDMDLTMQKWDTQAMIKERRQRTKRGSAEVQKERTVDICRPYEFLFHSRPDTDLTQLDYPGRQEYLQFLQEVTHALYESKEDDEGPEQLCVDKEELLKDLEEDLKSIQSCLTSMDSSNCTNLTNDSGSFLLMDGKTKVALDYIRKSLVPFEELQRARFHVQPIDVDAEEGNPFRLMPFSGQRRDQMEMVAAKDTFFTFNTRLQNGLRLRLEVPVVDVRQKLLGCGKHKYPGAVTTDIDENYVLQLKNRPLVKMFNFKSGRSFIKDALRLKFESMLIQGQIVRTKIYDRLNEQHWENMQRIKLLYEKLFAKWEKIEYEAAMSVVYKVKSYYDMTDMLKREFRELERQQLILNLDIVFTEGHWIRRIMLQNFHYLLADQDWRYKNDWIHRVEGSADNEDEEPELENFEESITKRNIVNIRQREKDDAWAIKAFYEDVYLQNKHPLLFVFPDAESFLKGIENLKVKTFVLLLELHFTLSIHTELQGRLETFEEWCIEDLKEKEEYVSRKCAKKYFMEDRGYELHQNTLDFLNQPVETSFNDEAFSRDRAVIAQVWREVVPANMRGSSDQELEPIEMVAMMSDMVLELIGKFETIDMNHARKVEADLRRHRAYMRKLSQQAYQVERRIDIEMKKVRKNLEPPYQKPKRVGKLPRLYIKKKVPQVVVQEKQVSEYTKFFFRAFHDEGDVTQLGDARESLCVIDTIQEQIVPFYFDHFLKLNGYTPNYNFKTQVELRDGPELARLQVRSVIPEIMDKLERWNIMRRKIMEDNIAHNPKMYENVNY